VRVRVSLGRRVGSGGAEFRVFRCVGFADVRYRWAYTGRSVVSQVLIGR
jgi:hypothetical protein